MENKDIPALPAPEVKPITDLPDFVKACADKLWTQYGFPTNKNEVAFAFNGVIYSLNPVPQDLYVHECVHLIRQGAGKDLALAEEWWSRYVTETAFRLEEETLAYREQYKFIARRVKKPLAFEHAKRLAMSMASPVYGNMISFNAALNAIIKP